ncbi:hypothetical protein MRB53_040950 [Persea americana]|nr:hypothetical protein MRB53_040950 [Persea americana]
MASIPVVRPAGLPQSKPSLLPAFEPSSSPSSLPRPTKRRYDGSPCTNVEALKHILTPEPSSSTAINSSPPRARSTRPPFARTASVLSERVPLASVPSVDLPSTGELLMGRSSNSSHYQLSANRLISRIHVRATYLAPTPEHASGEVMLECLGWNGIKVHCRGQAYELGKGDTFSSDKPESEIMLDVQDARVLLQWPAEVRCTSTPLLRSVWDEDDSPERTTMAPAPAFGSSPPVALLHSPVSPSPHRSAPGAALTFIGLPPGPTGLSAIEVYEDGASADEAPKAGSSSPSPVLAQQSLASDAKESQSSLSSIDGDFSDQDEENDPVIQSFGPCGDNLLPRLASIQAVSPARTTQPEKAPAAISPEPEVTQAPTTQAAVTTPSEENVSSTSLANASPIRNHVINQLAFSRLHSLPLSTILNNLPVSLKGRNSPAPANEQTARDELPEQTLTIPLLQALLSSTPCIGSIPRQGKDAANKPLENEFYYIPEHDGDEMRRAAVESHLGKTGIRSVRKQHKVCC